MRSFDFVGGSFACVTLSLLILYYIITLLSTIRSIGFGNFYVNILKRPCKYYEKGIFLRKNEEKCPKKTVQFYEGGFEIPDFEVLPLNVDIRHDLCYNATILDSMF